MLERRGVFLSLLQVRWRIRFLRETELHLELGVLSHLIWGEDQSEVVAESIRCVGLWGGHRTTMLNH